MKHPAFFMSWLLAGALVLLAATPADACLWTYGTSLQGGGIQVNWSTPETLVRSFTPYRTRAEWERDVAAYERESGSGVEPSSKRRNDHAVALLYVGRTKESVALLEELERSEPGKYVVAANLGTAYELDGDLEKALSWIREGIRRNPDAHHGSEWLHVRILEAQRELRADPSWLSRHSVLGKSFGQDLVPALPEGLDDVAVRRLIIAIHLQLRERLYFVPTNDPIVADLLFDMANASARALTVEHAIALLRVAISRGTVHRSLAERRIAHFEGLVMRRQVQQGLFVGALVLASVGAIVWIRRRRRREAPVAVP